MENNEQAMSGVQTAETEQEMSSLDKAKELFEYEMTDVLLNFRNEVSQLRNDPNAEFLRREYKTPEFDFTAPELTVQKSELSFGSDVQEINVECKSVEGSLVDVQAVKGVKNALMGGEGFFNTVVTGPGRVLLQTMPIWKWFTRLRRSACRLIKSASAFLRQR